MPARNGSLRETIGRRVEAFFAENAPEESCLVLDGTGPEATKHYIVLSAIGPDRLRRMHEVHTFSGGVFAYFGYDALRRGFSNPSLQDLAGRDSEAAIRRFHHPSMLGPVQALARLAFKKTAFGGPEALVRTLDFIFTSAHLARRLDDFPPNLRVYVGERERDRPVALWASGGETPAMTALAGRTIREIVAIACLIPFVYGRPDRSETHVDAVYTKGYLGVLKKVSSSGRPTLVATPWREGQRGKVTFVRCYAPGREKLRMMGSFVRLMLNIPTTEWSRDIADAFLAVPPASR